MIKRIITITAILLSIFTQDGFAANETQPAPSLSGRLFNLSYIGNALTINTTTPPWFYQFAGIQSLTAGFNFLNCTSENGLCLFSASDAINGTPTLRGPAIQPQFKLCLNAIGNTYSCESFNMGERFAYVVNLNGFNISLCSINSSNGNFGTCIDSGALLLASPINIVINKAGTLVYVTNLGNNTVLTCAINIDGTLSACSTTAAGGLFIAQPSGIALNSAGTIAYVTVRQAPNGPSISKCSINAAGAISSCTNSNPNTTFSDPSGIALNSAGTFAYVANATGNSVSVCTIDSAGSLGSCTASNPGATFSTPRGIVLNNAGAFAYVANGGANRVSQCSINVDGSLGTCVDSGATTIVFPEGITLNRPGTFAYITNTGVGTNSVTKCAINANGSLSSCNAATGAPQAFNRPLGIALF